VQFKEGYSRQIRGFKQFQDSADRTRKKLQAVSPAVERLKWEGRKDTLGRSEVSSSFKTQQTGQGRILKADSNGSQRPGHEAKYKLTILLYFVLLFIV
jgi:hypothetical protein